MSKINSHLLTPACGAFIRLMSLATVRHAVFFKKLSLGNLSQNLFAEFRFIKIIAVVIIVGMVTDFEMTFTGDLFKVAWKNNDFKVSISQKLWLWSSHEFR